MKKYFQPLIDMVSHPTIEERAKRDLQQAKRELYEAQEAEAYARSIVQFNHDRIARLERRLEGKK